MHGSFSKQCKRRRFVVGDIHGCSRTLKAMVENVMRLEADDTLFLLGDYIDRGPDSKAVLDYLLHLIKSDFDIRPLMGNHEEMLLNAVADPTARSLWYGNGGWGTLQEFSAGSPEAIPQRYLDFMASLPLMHLLDDYLLVHAGLDFRKTDPIIESTSHDLLWARDYRVNPVILAGRTLVTGHSVTPLFEIKAALTTNHITLDNGCYSEGEIGCGALVALNMNTREMIVQKNIETEN